jgi:hypothetical protein
VASRVAAMTDAARRVLAGWGVKVPASA